MRRVAILALFVVAMLVAVASCGMGLGDDRGTPAPGTSYWGWQCADGTPAPDAGCPPKTATTTKSLSEARSR
jgi:hypothetical protein